MSFDPNDFGAMEAHVASVQKSLPNALASVSRAVSSLVMPEAQAAGVSSPEAQAPRASTHAQASPVVSSGVDGSLPLASSSAPVALGASPVAPLAATSAEASGFVFNGSGDASKSVASGIVSGSKQSSVQALGRASAAAAVASTSGTSSADAPSVGAGSAAARANSSVSDSKGGDKSMADATDGVSQALSRVAPFLGQLRDPAKAQAVLPQVRQIDHVQIIDCGVKSGSNDPYVKLVRTLKTDPFTRWHLDPFGKWLEE
jgi:hypothetical protein